MSTVDLSAKIPNNVDLSSDKRLQRALEAWQPKFIDWWKEMGPEGFQEHDIYLRTAISVDTRGLGALRLREDARLPLGHLPRGRRSPTARSASATTSASPPGRRCPASTATCCAASSSRRPTPSPRASSSSACSGDTAPCALRPAQPLPGQRRGGPPPLGDGLPAPDLLRPRRPRGGRGPAAAPLGQPRQAAHPRRRSTSRSRTGSSFFMFTTFTDRDGKYQLLALAESGFDPLSRTCRFMLTEEAHHMFVGETGVRRVIQRTAELMKQVGTDPAKVRAERAIDLPTIQSYLNLWYTSSLDLFGGERSSNAADFFAAGLKGRYQEERYDRPRGARGHLRPARARARRPHGDREGPAAQRDERAAARQLRRPTASSSRSAGTASSRRRTAPSGSASPRAASAARSASTPTAATTSTATRSTPRRSRRTARSGCPRPRTSPSSAA